MIVYQALSAYQILECIEHKQIYHKDQQTILILGTFILEKYPNYKQLETSGLFNQVVLFEFGGLNGSVSDILNEVRTRIEGLLCFDLSEVDKIYIAGIHTYFSMYLVNENIHFSMFEDGTGALSRPWVLAEIAKKASPKKYEIINSYNLYTHECECIDEKWCNFKSQLADFYDKKAVDFDVVESFEKMSDDAKEATLKFYGIEKKIHINENSILILTQQFSNLGQLTFDEHIKIYQNLFDYFMPEDWSSIVLKLHPDDIMYYKKLFPGVNTINTPFPSELLPYAFSIIPNTIATITSTGVNLIGDKFPQVLKFNELYEKSFHSDHIYYVTSKLLELWGGEIADSIGVNETQLTNHLHAIHSNIKVYLLRSDLQQKSKILLVDDYEHSFSIEEIINKSKTYDYVFFMNSLSDYRMFDGTNSEVFEKCVPIQVNVFDSTSYIWILANKEWKDDFSIKKKLNALGGSMEAIRLNDDQLEMQRLKGLLAATEKRLISAIEEKNKLEKQLEIYEQKEV